MNRAYPEKINWENWESTATPINDTNLNKMDSALYEIDGRVVTFNTTKANQTDLLQTIKTLTYNTQTGVFVFTFWNGSTYTVDLNIEKIPVDFSMDENGVITMTTADGTTYTCDISELIKLYTFVDSSEIDFTTTTDASGNKTITAQIKAGSITGDKLQPNYLADCVDAKNAAELAASSADADALISEGFAVGEQNGVPVPSTSPYYNNNAKYYASQAQTSEGLLASGDVTLYPDSYSMIQDNFPQGLNIPLNPTLVIATDTDYEVVRDIEWRGTTSSGTLTIDFSGSPIDTSMTVNYKVYYKKS